MKAHFTGCIWLRQLWSLRINVVLYAGPWMKDRSSDQRSVGCLDNIRYGNSLQYLTFTANLIRLVIKLPQYCKQHQPMQSSCYSNYIHQEEGTVEILIMLSRTSPRS